MGLVCWLVGGDGCSSWLVRLMAEFSDFSGLIFVTVSLIWSLWFPFIHVNFIFGSYCQQWLLSYMKFYVSFWRYREVYSIKSSSFSESLSSTELFIVYNHLFHLIFFCVTVHLYIAVDAQLELEMRVMLLYFSYHLKTPTLNLYGLTRRYQSLILNLSLEWLMPYRKLGNYVSKIGKYPLRFACLSLPVHQSWWALLFIIRAIYEKSLQAFVSFIQSYSKHECHLIFQVKGQLNWHCSLLHQYFFRKLYMVIVELDIGKLAVGFALLHLPSMPELKGRTVVNFTAADIDFSLIEYRWDGSINHIPLNDVYNRCRHIQSSDFGVIFSR